MTRRTSATPASRPAAQVCHSALPASGNALIRLNTLSRRSITSSATSGRLSGSTARMETWRRSRSAESSPSYQRSAPLAISTERWIPIRSGINIGVLHNTSTNDTVQTILPRSMRYVPCLRIGTGCIMPIGNVRTQGIMLHGPLRLYEAGSVLP